MAQEHLRRRGDLQRIASPTTGLAARTAAFLVARYGANRRHPFSCLYPTPLTIFWAQLRAVFSLGDVPDVFLLPSPIRRTFPGPLISACPACRAVVIEIEIVAAVRMSLRAVGQILPVVTDFVRKLVPSVGEILLVRTDEKVRRIAAGRVIAPVADEEMSGVGATEEQIGESVHSYILTINPKCAVALGSGPVPTIVGTTNVDLAKNSRDQCIG